MDHRASAVLVLLAIGNSVQQDATGFYGFGINPRTVLGD